MWLHVTQVPDGASTHDLPEAYTTLQVNIMNLNINLENLEEVL